MIGSRFSWPWRLRWLAGIGLVAVLGLVAPPVAADTGEQAAEPSDAPAVPVATEPSDAAAVPAAAEPGEPTDDEASKAARPLPGVASPAAPATAEVPVTAITKLSPDPSHIGDLLELEVVVAYPDGYSVNLPTGVEFAPLELVDVEEGEAESTGTGWRRTFRVQLQYFRVGEASIPSFALTYVDPQGNVHTLPVAARKFTVESLLANEADPTVRPEDPPVSPQFPAESAEMAIYAGLAALLAGLVLARMWARWRKRVKPVPVVPPIPPHERALGALSSLESRRAELLESGRVADYYLELTEITKHYVQSRFGVDALDRTTDEIRRALTRAGDRLTPLSATELVKFLQQCDLVKFARFAPTDDDAQRSLDTVRDMVDRSTPTPAPEQSPASASARERDALSNADKDRKDREVA